MELNESTLVELTSFSNELFENDYCENPNSYSGNLSVSIDFKY